MEKKRIFTRSEFNNLFMNKSQKEKFGEPQKIKVYPDDENLLFKCPWCDNDDFLVHTTRRSISCTIYRHGVFKKNHFQIQPHLTEEKCKTLIENEEIYGCAKPIRIIIVKDTKTEELVYYFQKCEYC
jgi:hypothetical protein